MKDVFNFSSKKKFEYITQNKKKSSKEIAFGNVNKRRDVNSKSHGFVTKT